MACVVYDTGNVYLFNSNSPTGLQYYTLEANPSSDPESSGGGLPASPFTKRAPATPVLLNNTERSTFEPSGRCGYYNSHLYMIGTSTLGRTEGPAVADIDIATLSSHMYSVINLPSNYTNITSVAKVSQPERTDCLALSHTTGFQLYCVSDGTETGTPIDLGVPVNNLLSYSSDKRLLLLMEENGGLDYPIDTVNYFNSSIRLMSTSTPQKLPTGNIVFYKESNVSIEALLVSGDQPTITHISKNRTGLTYTNRTLPASLKTGLEYYIAVGTSDINDPPIYVVTKEGENDYTVHRHTLAEFAVLPPTTNDNGNGPGNGSGGNDSGDSSNNAGAIAGGVVGGIVGLALIIGLLIFFLRKRRKSRQPEFESIGEKSQSSTAAWNFGTSSIKQVQEAQNLTHVRNLNVSPAELEALEPTSALSGGAIVLKGAYQLTRDPPVFGDDDRVPKYVTRSIVNQSSGKNYTLHYFTQSTQGAFMRSVNTTCAIDSPRVIQHQDAIALSQSTQPSGYRYLWITAPCIPTQSLHNALAGQDKNVDLNDYPFKAWSTYALLEAVKDIHAANFAHLGLKPSCFFYADPEDSISDWQVTGFDQAHPAGERLTEARLNQWSAPELFSTASSDNRRCFRQTVQTASDIWSLGCIIYTLATGRNLTIDLNHTAELSRRDRDQLYIRVTSACNEAGTINESYRTLLEGMLQPDPSRRSTAEHLADYWKEANGLYDDNEEENNEAEGSVVSP
ncbi:kinase-like domain-containing protein [Fennellomyces sp. T-0311]|nr:kinase-like domain-containing protein [Fennellomyces sp. T-0311]